MSHDKQRNLSRLEETTQSKTVLSLDEFAEYCGIEIPSFQGLEVIFVCAHRPTLH